MGYYKGQTVIVTGTLTQPDGTAFNFADFTTFAATIRDTNGNSVSYSAAGGTILVNASANTYYFEITAAQSATLTGSVECEITVTYPDSDYSITATEIKEFELGDFVDADN
jgi:hypothetical protein